MKIGCSTAARGRRNPPHVSREPIYAVRLAVLGLRDLYANLLASSVVKQSKIVDIRRLYEPTLKFEGTRGYLHTIEH
jgi:hypothetical protein